jgi:hypothetical protein
MVILPKLLLTNGKSRWIRHKMYLIEKDTALGGDHIWLLSLYQSHQQELEQPLYLVCVTMFVSVHKSTQKSLTLQKPYEYTVDAFRYCVRPHLCQCPSQ